MKYTKVLITAELEIPSDVIWDEETVCNDLVGAFTKIKSGQYENMACGNVISASLVKKQTRRREECPKPTDTVVI